MSSHLRFAAFLHLLCFGLVAVGADPVLFSICSSSGSGNYSSLYSSNLKKLESYLPKQTPWVGFSLASVGSGQDQANGPACPVPRGCMSTLQTAEHAFQRQGMRSINKLCQNSRGGVIWYDSCLFKYSDQEFFGQIDNQNKDLSYGDCKKCLDEDLSELPSCCMQWKARWLGGWRELQRQIRDISLRQNLTSSN
ncbi:hypothetical protein Dimus_009641 [Dionaea muscipula]